MSTVVSKNVQIGADGTASNNFTAYQPATPDGTLRIGNGNSGSVTDAITLTSAGNVGIGTSSPSSYASTTLEISGSSASSDLKMTNTTTGTGDAAGFDLELNGSDINYVNRTASGNQKFWTNSTERMRITSAGNVGIGTSSPANALHVKGVTTVAYIESTGINGDIQLKASGTTGYTALRANGNDLAFLTATAERMRITSAGNVGIGGTVDNHGGYARCLQITGTEAALELESSSGYSYVAQNGTDLQIRNVANGNMPFSTNNTERMRIDSAGNVGIGTSSPGEILQVSKAVGATASPNYAIGLNLRNSSDGGNRILFGNNVTTTLAAIDGTVASSGAGTNDGVLAFHTAVDGSMTERARIDSAGRLLIGGTSTYDFNGQANLVVNGTAGLSTITVASPTSGHLVFADGTSGTALYAGNIAYHHASNAMTFGTDGVFGRVTIDSSGNVIVLGAGSGSLGKLTTRSDGGTPLAVSNESVSGTLVALMGNGSGNLGSITHNGSGVAYNTTSDYRLKEDWVAVADASTRVNLLKPVNFAWKADGSRVDGFLAHELAEVVPEAVTGEKDAVELVDIKDEGGNVTGQEERPVYQGIDQSKLVPLLTAALQEALAEINSLKARLDAANL
jgi:hypothetical protein